MQVFQLVDLQDVSLQREVLAFPRKREPTATGGWFRIKDMDLLRRRVVVRTKHSMKGHGTRDLQSDVFEEREEWMDGLRERSNGLRV